MKISVQDRPAPKVAATGIILVLLMLSAALAETDAYRYAALAMAAYGTWIYARLEPRPRVSWEGLLCLVWSIYVIIRLSIGYLDTPNHLHGSSEWLYAFPMFFPMIGIGLLRIRHYFQQILAIFFAIALILLAVSQHWFVIAAGWPATPLFHNNQIHGAVACGLILIGAIFWFLHHAQQGLLQSFTGRFARAIVPVIVVLCIISIFGSQSKGVWLALAAALPLIAVMMLLSLRRPVALRALLALAVAVAALVALFYPHLQSRVGPSLSALASMVRDYQGGSDLVAYMQSRIDAGTIPETINARLKIWYNAAELIVQAPWFGHGNMWIELWDHTRYANVGYTLMHNGYLEILIRHGFAGMAVLALMLGCFLRMMQRGYRAGVVSLAGLQAYWVLLVFFMLTLLSNSNNRLAIGESFAMLAGGVAFYAQTMERALAARRATAPAGKVPGHEQDA